MGIIFIANENGELIEENVPYDMRETIRDDFDRKTPTTLYRAKAPSKAPWHVSGKATVVITEMYGRRCEFASCQKDHKVSQDIPLQVHVAQDNDPLACAMNLYYATLMTMWSASNE